LPFVGDDFTWTDLAPGLAALSRTLAPSPALDRQPVRRAPRALARATRARYKRAMNRLVSLGRTALSRRRQLG
jgi:hypothetical protein